MLCKWVEQDQLKIKSTIVAKCSRDQMVVPKPSTSLSLLFSTTYRLLDIGCKKNAYIDQWMQEKGSCTPMADWGFTYLNISCIYAGYCIQIEILFLTLLFSQMLFQVEWLQVVQERM